MPVLDCTCRKPINAHLRASVYEAEREFLSSLGEEALEKYKQIVRSIPKTWGLCPAHDRDLKNMVLNWGVRVGGLR